MTKDLLKKDTYSEQIEYLLSKLKENQTISPKSDAAYHHRALPLTQSLCGWITEEIHFLEKRHFLSHTHTGEDQQTSFKLKTNLSVPQVAYFIKLMMDTGIIQNKNVVEVLRQVAQKVETPKAPHISLQSLRSKYYQPDNHTLHTLRDISIQFLNKLRP